MEHTLPTYDSTKFACPHCNVVAIQKWFNSESASDDVINIFHNIYLNYGRSISDIEKKAAEKFLTSLDHNFSNEYKAMIPEGFSLSTCDACSQFAVWVDEIIVYPLKISVQLPNEDLNAQSKKLYLEAAIILDDSPKGATALLRLALQHLLIQLGGKGKDINEDIKKLVAAGLSPKIQQALEMLRVVGNNAVRLGSIDLDDNKEIALKLFQILNFIAREMITQPREINDIFDDIIPEGVTQKINKRDKLLEETASDK